jgi:hypothetical protein
MTEQEKRIKLAEAQGLTGWEEARCLPNYFSDLNAVHELEKTLQHYGVFVDRLAEIMGQPRQGIMLVNATAAQRSEALGLTLNLW